jgi:DNA polymerase III subunit delta
VAKRLAGWVEDDVSALNQDIEKLLVYSGDDEIAWSAIELLVPSAHEAKIFSLIDLVVEGNATVALKEMHRILSEGGSPVWVLTMLARQFRMLLLLKERILEGARPSLAATEVGFRSFVIDKAVTQVARYSVAQLDTIYRRLVDIDLANKTSRSTLEVDLETLITELAMKRI